MEFDAREMIMNFQSKIDPRGRGREELYKLHCKAVIDQFEGFKKAQLEKADMPQPSPQDWVYIPLLLPEQIYASNSK